MPTIVRVTGSPKTKLTGVTKSSAGGVKFGLASGTGSRMMAPRIVLTRSRESLELAKIPNEKLPSGATVVVSKF